MVIEEPVSHILRKKKQRSMTQVMRSDFGTADGETKVAMLAESEFVGAVMLGEVALAEISD